MTAKVTFGKNAHTSAALPHQIKSNNQDFDALVAKLDDKAEDAAMENVALAQSDLENLLTKHGTFCFADLLLLDLSIRSESLEFVQSCISETVFMTPVVLAQVVDALTCAAEIVQDEIGYTGPIKSKDLAEIEAAIHALAWAFHELFKDPA